MTESFSLTERRLDKSAKERRNVVEKLVSGLNHLAEQIQRAIDVATDPHVKEGLAGLVRGILNLKIAIADLIPGIGEVFSLGHDVWKIITRLTGLKKYDLTPDVSLKIALLTELIDLITLGHFPTHVFEFVLQLRADIPRIRSAIKRSRELWNVELKEYREHPEIGEATETFGVSALPEVPGEAVLVEEDPEKSKE